MINSTQQAIDIAGIKDGVVVLKNGGYRLILQVSATNFALKSEQEQNSLVFQYQGFLNSLHFPIEIIIRSRQLDLTPYIKKIEQLAEKQTNDLIEMQIADYTDFLKRLIQMANIMKKTFYVVIPHDPLSINKGTFLDKLFTKKSVIEHLKISEEEHKGNVAKLKERASVVASGLGGMGLHCFQLTTEDLIELFYTLYNPDEASKERIKDMTMLSSPVIMAEREFGADTGEKKKMVDETIIDNANIIEEKTKRDAEIKKQEEDKNKANGPVNSPKPEEKEKQPEVKSEETVNQNQEPSADQNQSQINNTDSNA